MRAATNAWGLNVATPSGLPDTAISRTILPGGNALTVAVIWISFE